MISNGKNSHLVKGRQVLFCMPGMGKSYLASENPDCYFDHDWGNFCADNGITNDCDDPLIKQKFVRIAVEKSNDNKFILTNAPHLIPTFRSFGYYCHVFVPNEILACVRRVIKRDGVNSPFVLAYLENGQKWKDDWVKAAKVNHVTLTIMPGNKISTYKMLNKRNSSHYDLSFPIE